MVAGSTILAGQATNWGPFLAIKHAGSLTSQTSKYIPDGMDTACRLTGTEGGDHHLDGPHID